MWKKLASIFALVLLTQPAWAIYKCTVNGKTIYQETACQGSGSEMQIKATRPPQGATQNGQWRFFRSRDEMTGHTSCSAQSDTFYMTHGPRSRDLAPMQVVALKTGDDISVGVRLLTSVASVHNDIKGTGIKPSNGEFTEFDVRGQRFIAASDSKALLSAMLASSDVRVRVRFWPWEDLEDSKEIPLKGFATALKQLEDC